MGEGDGQSGKCLPQVCQPVDRGQQLLRVCSTEGGVPATWRKVPAICRVRALTRAELTPSGSAPPVPDIWTAGTMGSAAALERCLVSRGVVDR